MKKIDYPSWAFPTKRDFARTKRRELERVLAELNVLYTGCAYLPEYRKIRKVRALMDEIKVAMSPSRWVK